VISIVSELINNPLTDGDAFDSAVVESEKTKLCGRIEARINNPASHALRRCEEIMCAGERYSISPIGTVESVSDVTSGSLYRYYRSLPGNTAVDIYYAGSADTDMLAKRFAEIFSDFDCPLATDLTTEVIRKNTGEVKTFIEDMNVSQSKLVIGFRSGFCLSDDDYHIFSLMNCLLGASPTSKLFMNVREAKSLCYYCSSRPSSLKGLLTVSSGIEEENFEMTRDAILEQVDALKTGDISDNELESARKSLINSCKELSDSQTSLVSWYFIRSLANVFDTPEILCEKLKRVTKDEIITAAQRLSLDTVYFLRGTISSASDSEEDDE
jgi:predicted Zn-dependent peptidase